MSRNRVKFYNSIRFRLSAVIAIVIFLSVAVLSVISAQQSLSRETQSYRTLVEGAASAYAASVADAVADRDRMATLSSLRGIRDLPSVVQGDVVLSDGTVFVELGSGAWVISDTPSEQSLWRTDHIRISIPIVKSGSQIGELGMLVSIAPLRAEIIHNLVLTITLALIVSFIGIIFAQLFVSRLTAPIRKLSDIMTHFGETGSDDVQTLRKSKDETGLLTQSFENMIDRIEERDQQIARHVETLEETVEERTSDLRLAKEDAEAANAAKSDFLATMSHEIRTPMNGMMVMAEMLGAADLTPRHRRYAEIIHRSGNSLLTIINDILDLSKIEAGQLDLEQIPVSPEHLAADVAALFWERARSKNLELATYVSPAVPEEILADPTRLNQVISNLVNNALKFTDEGGVLIRIDADKMSTDRVSLIIEVIDTGIGIPEDKIDQIFDSFSQADQSTTRRFGGTGLGLTVCKRLVSAMQGEISVSSIPGDGSTFRVTFPTTVQQSAPDQTAYKLRVGLGLKPGLVRSALERSLKNSGCQLDDSHPALWITTSGQFTSGSAPTVLLSDMGDTQADRLLQDGAAVDCLSQPFLRRELTDLLNRAESSAFRGVDAIEGGGSRQSLKTFEGLRILAADDNAVNREVLREALATLKAEAVFVEDGAQAVKAFELSEFDLVFMDGSMPVMDGFEATHRMRALEAETGRLETPIYALTAQVAGMSDQAWSEAGANGHILKPFSLEKLSDVMAGADTKIEPASPADETASATPQSLLNQETIATLETLGEGPNGVRDKVWAMFNQKASGMLSQLHAFMETGTPEDVAKQAHAFKSMALSSGLSGVADELQRLEVLAKDADPTSIRELSKTRIAELLDQTQTEMQQHKTRAA